MGSNYCNQSKIWFEPPGGEYVDGKQHHRNRSSEGTAEVRSFADRETEKVYNQIFSKKLPESIQKVALRKLIMIDNAVNLGDLRVPPNYRLEALSRDREGQYSIRINEQCRVCFKWKDNDFYDVEIVDYP